MLPDAIAPAIDAVAPVTRRFAEAGHRLYLVGGIVRDLLAGRPVRRQDLDLTTDAEPGVVKALVSPVASSLWTQGERFGTIGCIVEGQDLEITTHRAEQYSGSTRKPTVEFSDDVVADLSRRDFTINSIAIEVTTGSPRLIDPFDGAGDLAAAVLRTPIDPEVSFTDDPLRMLRAARFIAGFGLSPVPELTAAVSALRDRMSIVSKERVRDEIVKLLAVEDPTPGLDFLASTGLLRDVLPDIADRGGVADALGCHADRWAHTVAVVAAAPPGGVARLAGLLAPPWPSPPSGAAGAGHDDARTEVTIVDELRSLRFSNESSAAVSTVARAREALERAGGSGSDGSGSDGSVRRFVLAAGGQVDATIELGRAEATARSGSDGGDLGRCVERVAERLEVLGAAEDLGDLTPVLDGDAVMAHLGVRPGRDVGAALRHLVDQRIELGPRGRDAELADLDRWWTDRSS